MKWNPKSARNYLVRTANDLIEDGFFFEEAGSLLCEARHNDNYITEAGFKGALRRILEWDDYTINETIKEIML